MAQGTRRWTTEVFFHSIDPIIIEDLEGVVLDLNPRAEKVYGYSRDELIGLPIISLVPPERHGQARELLKRCLAGEEISDVEGIRWDRDENRIPVLLALSALKDEQGKTFAVATIAKDLSELKSAEAEKEMMAQVFMDATDPIILEDMDGNILDVNKETICSYGFSREELIGNPIRMLVPPERHAQAIDLLERCLAGEDVRNVEGLRWTKDKNVIYVLLALSALSNENGKITAIATIAKDITILKKTETELAKEREMLEVRVTERTRDLQQARNNLEQLADTLSHYLSPQIYDSIFKGKQESSVAAKRRWLTIYFSDIAGFTSATESLDSEDLTTLLNEYFSEMTNIVLKHGGTLDKYVGDAIMVFFGDPETKGRNEDACACVSMALEMQQRMKTLREEWARRGVAQSFHVRSGIASGYCTVGNFGSEQHMSYTCIGRHVNLASRLEAAAEPDQVLISKATWLLVDGHYKTIRLEPIVAKGFDQPVDAHAVLGEISERSRPTVFHKSAQGFSLWLDPQSISQEDRKAAAKYLRQILSSIDD